MMFNRRKEKVPVVEAKTVVLETNKENVVKDTIKEVKIDLSPEQLKIKSVLETYDVYRSTIGDSVANMPSWGVDVEKVAFLLAIFTEINENNRRQDLNFELVNQKLLVLIQRFDELIRLAKEG